LRHHRTPRFPPASARRHETIPWARAVSILIAAIAAACGPARAADLQIEGTPRGTRVIVDGQLAGTLPLAHPITVGAGVHQVHLELAGYRPIKTHFEASSIASIFSMHYDLMPIDRRQESIVALVIAGNGQRAMGHRTFGLTLTAAEAGGLTLAIYGEAKLRNDQELFNEAQAEYAAGLSPATINAARAKTNDAYDAMGSSETLRNVGIGIAAAAVTVGLVDFWLRTPASVKNDASARSETGGLDVPLPTALARAALHFHPDVSIAPEAAIGGSFWCSF